MMQANASEPMTGREALHSMLVKYAARNGQQMPELPCPYPAYDPRFKTWDGWKSEEPPTEPEGKVEP